jgi:hypothetical protein
MTLVCAHTGVRRMPALLTAERQVAGLLDSYEVVMCEPLHDLKNVISAILEELPHQIEERSLKRKVTEFCSTCARKWVLLNRDEQ